MMDKQAAELVTEIKKIRNDMDAVKAYCLTIAEQVTIIATNTTPADSETEPAEGTT